MAEATNHSFQFGLRGVNFELRRMGCKMPGVDVHLCAKCIVKELSAGIATDPTFIKP